MYSYVLSIAFLLQCFLSKITRLWNFKTILLIVTIFTTTSTTGIVIVLISLVFKLSGKLKNQYYILLIPIFAIFVVLLVSILNSKMNSMSGSVKTRLDDLRTGFVAWKQAPFFGNGMERTKVLLSNMDMNRILAVNGNIGFSSGLLDMLTKGGIYFTLEWLIIPIILFARINKNYFFFAIHFLLLTIVTIISNGYLYATIIIFMTIVGIEYIEQ